MIIKRSSTANNSEIKEDNNAIIDTIKAVEFPNKTFTSKAELFKHLVENEKDLVELKTSAIKNSEALEIKTTEIKEDTIKGDFEEGFIYPIINTTKYMDSHNDVHLNGIWKKSVKEQQGKVFYLVDHEMKIDSIIAHPKEVAMSIKTFTFKELGKDLEGETEALMFKVKADSIEHKGALKIINNKHDIQHSVRMQYIKVDLAINSDLKEDKAYKKTYDKYIEQVSNKEKAIENGYFWAVSEAKIFKEGSMLPFGSNDITPMIYPTSEPLKNTQENTEPTKVTQENEEKVTTRRRLI